MWAGDGNAADTTGREIKDTPLQVNPVKATEVDAKDAPPGPDFHAIRRGASRV
ncbi:MAG TPA: hypothetical protein VE673_09200 [Pseudonocardiaceae bacterium]|nr:hypothetical protein [Pseudonocardiaceae bacterium]